MKNKKEKPIVRTKTVYVKESPIKKILLFILAMFLGVAVFFGTIAGTLYYAVAYLTLDSLESMNIRLVGDGSLTPDSRLRSMSFLQLLADISAISSSSREQTLRNIISYYGLVLSDQALEQIPPEYLDLDLRELSQRDTLTVLLEVTTLGTLLKTTSMQASVSEPAYNAMKGRSLALFFVNQAADAFRDVYLGDLIGAEPKRNPDGTVEAQFADPDDPQIAEFISVYPMSKMGATLDAGGDLSDPIIEILQLVPMSSLITSDDGNVFTSVLCRDGLTVGDLLTKDSAGILNFDLSPLTEGLTIGDLMNYDYDEDKDAYYKKGTNERITGVNATLAPILLDDFASGSFDLMSEFDDLYVGEIIGYTLKTDDAGEKVLEDGQPVFYKEDHPSERPTGIMKTFATLKLKDLSNNNTVTDRVNNTLLGDAMGYHLIGGVWYMANKTTKVSGIFRSLSNYTIGELDSAVTSELTLADLLGYEPDNDGVYKKDGTPASGLIRLLLPSTMDTIDDDMNGIYIAEVMGFSPYNTETEEGVTARADMAALAAESKLGFRSGDVGSYTYPTGPISCIADLTIGNLQNQETITQRIKSMKVGTAMDFTQGTDGIWRDATDAPVSGVLSAIVDTPIDNLPGKMETLTIGESLGYKKISNVWYEADGVTPAPTTGFMYLLGLDTLINEIGSRADEMNDTSIKEFCDAGILNLDTSKKESLDVLFAGAAVSAGKAPREYWESLTLDEFIGGLIP